MILPSIAKCAGVLLSVIATLADADLIIDDTCTTAQKATLNAAFLTAQSVANKGLIRTEAIDTDDLEASDISIEEVNRVNRLMTAFFAVDPMDPDYSTALNRVGCKPSPPYRLILSPLIHSSSSLQITSASFLKSQKAICPKFGAGPRPQPQTIPTHPGNM